MGNLVTTVCKECFKKRNGEASTELSGAGAAHIFSVCGKDVQIEGNTISGDGSAISCSTIDQDAAYWEVVVREVGMFSVGVLRQDVDIDGNPFAQGMKNRFPPEMLQKQLTELKGAWGLRSGAKGVDLVDGDVVGLSLNQNDLPMLKFFKNGQELESSSIKRVRGSLVPAVSVELGAQLEIVFAESRFQHQPKGVAGQPLMSARNLL